MLEVVRRRTRHAWLLHAWLILSLLLLPAGRLARADNGDGFTYTTTESAVSVSVSAPEGTAGMQTGDTRQVIACAEMNTWEIWTNSTTGATETRSPLTASLAGSALTFSVSGDGSVDSSSGATDNSGNCVTSFTMGTGASTVTVSVDDCGATGSITFEEPSIPETWEWDHDESLVTASVASTGTADNVTAGETRAVQVYAEYSSWSIEMSNLGNTRTVGYQTSPAIGAQVSWSVSGGGALDDGPSETDSNGYAGVAFTMGSAASLVRADVSFASSSSTYGTCELIPPQVEEIWTFDHSNSSISEITLAANGTTDGLSAEDSRTVTATVTAASYDVLVSNLGNTMNDNYTTGPGSNVAVSFSVDYGDGTLSSYSATTDADGNASVDFTMGSELTGSGVSASAESASASITFGALGEEWYFDHSDSATSVSNVSAGGTTELAPGDMQTVAAEVTTTTWDVEMSNYGNVRSVNESASYASGVTVSFSVISGDGALSSGSATTDEQGQASVTFTMAEETSVVEAAVDDGAGGTASGTITLSRAVAWTYHHTETTIATTVATDGSVDMVTPGSTRAVTANVAFESWDVYVDEAGNTDFRDYASGGANGAPVYWAVTQGNGTLTDMVETTDANGNASATFTMGTQSSTVQADASYAGASSSGTLDFTWDDWTYHHSESALRVTLADDADASTATATVTLDTWDVYYDSNSNPDNRNFSSGPAGGAYVAFTANGQVSVSTDSATTSSDGTATTGYSVGSIEGGSITADASFMDASATDIVYVTMPPDRGEAPTLTRKGAEYVLFSKTDKVSLNASGGRAPYPTDGGSYTHGAVSYIFSYTELTGYPGSGVANQSSNLSLDRNPPGYTEVTVQLQQEWIPIGAAAPEDNPFTISPKSLAVKVKVQKPAAVEEVGNAVFGTRPGGFEGLEHTLQVNDQVPAIMVPGGQPIIEDLMERSDFWSLESPGILLENAWALKHAQIDNTLLQGKFKDLIGVNVTSYCSVYENYANNIGVTLPNGATIIITLKTQSHEYSVGAFLTTPELKLKGTFNYTTVVTATKVASGSWITKTVN